MLGYIHLVRAHAFALRTAFRLPPCDLWCSHFPGDLQNNKEYIYSYFTSDIVQQYTGTFKAKLFRNVLERGGTTVYEEQWRSLLLFKVKKYSIRQIRVN